MPSIYDLKPKFQQLLMPVMSALAKQGVTPNQVTWSALILSALGGVAVWFSPQQPTLLLSIPVLLFVRMALNAIDGMLARQHQLSSRSGEILNEVGDIVSDTLLYLPLIHWFESSFESTLLLALFVWLASLSEFCGVLAKAMIGTRQYAGPMGKSDRAFVIGLLSLWLYFTPELCLRLSPLILALLNTLLILSCWNRLSAILKVKA